MAQITPDPINPQQKINPADFTSPAEVNDEAALQLVVQDTKNTESWLQTNYWSLRWREADALYQALALDTPIRAKDGFIPIRDVHVGCEVFGPDGKLHTVIGESPVYEDRLCFEITFNTGEKVIADACHLWETTAAQQTIALGVGKNPNSAKRGLKSAAWKHGAYTAVRSTQEIFDTCYYGTARRHNHKIALTAALEYCEKEFSIDPYVLGVWLGDGDSDAPRVTSMDSEVIQNLEKIENRIAKEQSREGNQASRFAFTCYETKRESLEYRLRILGVLYNKHIPQQYFNSSVEQRLSLLQGLLDTDGNCVKEGHVTFRNTNQLLAEGVKQLVCSLGWRATIKCYHAARYSTGRFYSVHFTPPADILTFRIRRKFSRQQDKRKTSKHFRSIVSVIPVPSVPVKCLSVEGEFYLITDGLIVTHNSPPGVLLWEGTTVPRSNVNRFVVAETVNSIHPQIMNGLFYESPAFVLRPRPGLTQNATRAISELLSTELEDINFEQEVDLGIHSALLFGTGIWKWGFKNYNRKETRYERTADALNVPTPSGENLKVETTASTEYYEITEEVPVYSPTFEFRDVRFVLVDRGARVPDIRQAKFVIDRMYLTYNDLVKLKDEEYYEGNTLKKRYKLPSETEIKSWFTDPKEQIQQPGQTEAITTQGTTQVHHAAPRFQKTTEDPLNEPLEILERWDNDKVITVIQGVKVIRNEPNEFGCIPFLSVNWWPIPDAFWGLGLGRVLGVEQRVQAGIINACLDLANLIVNPMFLRSRGANIQEQQVRQRIGGIIAVDGPVKEALTLLEQPSIPPEVVQQGVLSQQRVERTSGANEQLTMGASPTGARGGGQLGRSGTGATGIIQATMNRLGGFAENFVRNVYKPFLYTLHKLNKKKVPMSYIRQVLGDRLGPEFKFNSDEFMTAPTEFEVLAGSHLAAKSQMAQSLFMMVQLFESAPIMDQLKALGYKVQVEELLHMMHDISGWKNYYQIVVPMTDQEKQAVAQQNPALMKVQGQMAVNQQKFGQDQQLIDQENEARVVRDMFRQIAEKSAEPEMLSGAEQPAQGLGSAETA